MADIGVLNLQIQDNSGKAADGLGRLAGALDRVKRAVQDGMNLGDVSRQITRLAKAVNEKLTGDVLDKIAKLSDALSKLNGLGNVNIRINGAGSVQTITDAIKEAQESVSGINTGFEYIGSGATSARNAADEFNSTVRETEALMRSTAWTGGVAQFRSMFEAWSRMRSAMSLGAGDSNLPAAEDTSGWAAWKEGAVEVEGTVTDATSGIGACLEGTQYLLTGVVEETNRATEATERFAQASKAAYGTFKEKYADYPERTLEDFFYGMRWRKSGEHEIEKYQQPDLISSWLQGNGTENEQTYAIREMAKQFKITVEEVKARIEELRSSASSAAPAVTELGNAMSSVSGHKTGMEQLTDYLDMSQIDLMTMKLNAMKDALAQDIEANKLDNVQIADRVSRIQQLSAKIDELKNKQEETTGSTHRIRDAFEELKGGIKDLGIVKLIGQFNRIAKYRLLRTVISEIGKGFSEGVKNVYQYSTAIGGSFATAMDSASSALLQMKNSIGAAVAPMIEALVPTLQVAVNWLINAVNYLNQFFALMNGQSTWTKAVPATAKAFDNEAKAAKGAANAVKDLLADWDELNIIQSQTGGGSGSIGATNAEDYLKMFEESGKFENKVKDIFDFLKENFDAVKTAAISIGAAILGWKISQSLADFLPFLSKIGEGISASATIILTLAVTDLTGNAFMDTGSPGWLIADALTGLVGSEIAKKLTEKILGESAGEIVQGFTLILSGIVNIENAVSNATQATKGRAFMLDALGAVEIGIGTALAMMGFGASVVVSLAAGTVTGAAALAIAIALTIDAIRKETYAEMARKAFSEAGENGINPEDYLKALQARMDDLTSGAKIVVDTTLGLDEHGENFTKTIDSLKALNAMVSGGEKLTENDAEAFKSAWDIVIKELGEISKINYETIYAGLDEAIANGSEKIRTAAIEMREAAIEAAGIMNGAQAKMEKEMEFLTNAISSGTATKEDIERYKQIYTVLAGETEDGLAGFREAMQNGATFDFTNGENPVNEALSFIQSLGADLVTPALEQVQAQYDAEVSAVEESKKQLEQYADMGYISRDSESYKQLTAFYDGLLALYKDRLTEQTDEINGSVNEAYNTILEQTLAGYLSLDQNDETALKSYIDNVFLPIVEEIEKYGGIIPEKIKAVLARGGETFNTFDVQRSKNQSSRKGFYESFLEQEFNGDIDDALVFSVAYELDRVGQDTTKIGEEDAKEIINGMISVFGDYDMQGVLGNLSEVFGWDLESIIGKIDFGELDEEQISELKSAIDTLFALQQENLINSTKASPNADNYLSWYEYTEAKAALDESYARIKELIETPPKGDIVLDPTLTQTEFTGKINLTPQITGFLDNPFTAGTLAGVSLTRRASGGFVRSGDLVMANENGNFEMMGRMGNQPVVANNQQIVSGISQGVASANGDVVSELRGLTALMQRMLNKEIVAKAVPSSSWGRSNGQSAAAYEKVTG